MSNDQVTGIETMEQDLTKAYETETCGRCGGGGHYSYCQMYGTTCFGCSGKGKVYTKRATAALAYGRGLRMVKVTEVQVGWLLWQGPGPFSRGGWFTVTEINPEGPARYKDGDEWKPYYELKTKDSGLCTFPGAEVQAVPDRARLIEIKREALAYQATLTKTGTVRKAGKR